MSAQRGMGAEQEALTVVRVRSWLRTGQARAIREQAGLSQADVGRAVGTSPAQISRWETVKSVPYADSALKLARLYDGLENLGGRVVMSTPYSVWTATGVEISVDRNSPLLLQFSVADRREGGAAWHLTTDLTAAEVAELHGYLGDWLEEQGLEDS